MPGVRKPCRTLLTKLISKTVVYCDHKLGHLGATNLIMNGQLMAFCPAVTHRSVDLPDVALVRRITRPKAL